MPSHMIAMKKGKLLQGGWDYQQPQYIS